MDDNGQTQSAYTVVVRAPLAGSALLVVSIRLFTTYAAKGWRPVLSETCLQRSEEYRPVSATVTATGQKLKGHGDRIGCAERPLPPAMRAQESSLRGATRVRESRNQGQRGAPSQPRAHLAVW